MWIRSLKTRGIPIQIIEIHLTRETDVGIKQVVCQRYPTKEICCKLLFYNCFESRKTGMFGDASDLTALYWQPWWGFKT